MSWGESIWPITGDVAGVPDREADVNDPREGDAEREQKDAAEQHKLEQAAGVGFICRGRFDTGD